MSETTYKTQEEAIRDALESLAYEGYVDEPVGTVRAAIRAHLAKVQPAAPETKRQMYVLSDPAPQRAAPVEVSEAMVEAAAKAHWEWPPESQAPHGVHTSWEEAPESLRENEASAMRAALTAALECQRGGA